MDPVTAKSLVSAALVWAIAAFSLIALRTLVAEVAADLRRGRAVAVRRPRRPGEPGPEGVRERA